MRLCSLYNMLVGLQLHFTDFVFASYVILDPVHLA